MEGGARIMLLLYPMILFKSVLIFRNLKILNLGQKLPFYMIEGSQRLGLWTSGEFQEFVANLSLWKALGIVNQVSLYRKFEVDEGQRQNRGQYLVA